MIRTLQRLAIITTGTLVMTVINALAQTLTGVTIAVAVMAAVFVIENGIDKKGQP